MKILSSLRMIILLIPLVCAVGQNPHDAWNYTYYRSTDPGGPVFHWVDITTTGSLATGLTDDNNVGPYPMGFTFPWYESGFNTFRIGSNGYITRRRKDGKDDVDKMMKTISRVRQIASKEAL